MLKRGNWGELPPKPPAFQFYFQGSDIMLDEYLEKCAVIGAAGKMGSGISLLILQEIARMEVERDGCISGQPRLILIDVNEDGLASLQVYLRAQLVRYAEKAIIRLRDGYRERKELVENQEMITDFVNGALSLIRLNTNIEDVADCKLIFEAILEDLTAKTEVFKKLKNVCGPDAYFLTNTSSIPITTLEEKACLKGRLIGYHFYNPPPVQKLVEVISTPRTDEKLQHLAAELGKRLQKTLVPSKDVAGFVGNGHFVRDALFGMELLSEIQGIPQHGAIYLVNRVSQDFMVRPMGIFQLMDYVGLDICQLIMKVMTRHIEGEILHSNLVDAMMKADAKGGQFPDGSQKDGFLKYVKGRPAGVYSLEEKRYLMIDEGNWVKKCDTRLGDLPSEWIPWRVLIKDPKKDEKLRAYFSALFDTDTLGAELARRYLLRSREIAQELVSDGIAMDITDVNTVLMNGFCHLYGPENDLF
jgi:3-hydroxyacyl-CoA dehydrogenase